MDWKVIYGFGALVSAGIMRGLYLGVAEIRREHAASGEKGAGMDWKVIYGFGAFITGAIMFIGCWIYCIATYGFLLGVGLGWLPSAICAVIGGFLWPLIAIGIVIGIVLFVCVIVKG